MPSGWMSLLKRKTTTSSFVVSLALLAVAELVFLLQALSYRYLSDDAFISFRYARNWAQGYGPIYNIGERVEGYTNFLWMAILAGLHRMGVGIVLAAQVLGVLLGLVTILLTFRFSLRWHRPSSPWAVLAACLLAVNVGFAAWATGGLETHLFTFLVLLSTLLQTYEVEQSSRFPWSALSMALCVMTRPDGLVFVALSGVYRLWVRRGRPNRQDVLWGLLFTILYVPYYVWRFSYYGYPFPNTFYAKYGGGLERLSRGVEHVVGFVTEYGGAPFAAMAGLLVILRQLHRDCAYLALLVSGFMAYVVWIGGDSLIEYRLLLVVTPLLYLLIQQSLWKICELVTSWWQKRGARAGYVPSILVAFMLLALVYLFVAQPAVQRSRGRVVQTRIVYEDFAAIGRWLQDQVPGEASLAVHHAGAMPFYAGLTTIDMYGLNDAHIAHRIMPDMGKGYAGHEKYDVDYVLSRRPTYIAPMPLRNRPFDWEDWHRFDDNPWFPDNVEMLSSPVFQTLYAPRSVDLSGHVSAEEGTIFNFFQLRDASQAPIQEIAWDLGQATGTAGWNLEQGMEVRKMLESSLLLAATDAESSMEISGLQLWATPCDRLTIQMYLTDETEFELSWSNSLAPQDGELRKLTFLAEPHGSFYTYDVRIGSAPSWVGEIATLRLHPVNQPAEMDIDSVRFERVCETGS
jgi:hypothetical protein